MYKTFNVITYALNFIGDIIYIIMYRDGDIAEDVMIKEIC